MDVDVIVALIGLSGISLGAFFSGLGYFFKVRSERKKTRKNVLFHLLEIRHLIRSEYSDPEEVLIEYTEYFKNYLIRRGFSEENAAASPELMQLLRNHFHNAALSVKPKIDDAFIESFEKSINALSYDAPIMAFKLKGRDRMNEFLAAQNNYLAEFEKFREDDALVFKTAVDKQLKNIHYEGIESLLKNFDDDIKMLSQSCGLLTRFTLRRLFQNTKKPEVKIDIAEMDKTMDKFFTDLATNITAQKEPVDHPI